MIWARLRFYDFYSFLTQFPQYPFDILFNLSVNHHPSILSVQTPRGIGSATLYAVSFLSLSHSPKKSPVPLDLQLADRTSTVPVGLSFIEFLYTPRLIRELSFR